MFDSGMTANALISAVNNEIDVAITIENSSYIRWINEVEQMLYSEVIRERKTAVVENPENPVTLPLPGTGEVQMRFEDIELVYADGVELTKSSMGNDVLTDTYYKSGGGLYINRTDVAELKIIYNVRPELKTAENINTKNIMLPYEFLELIISRLRGEAYKLANEDGLAAKWLADYNVLVETFKLWVENKRAKFGV